MAQSNWEADKMLDVYIYDYLVKRNLQATAKAFMAEAKVATDPVAIDAPGGFLFEWWSVFWDIFIARTNEKHSDVAAAYLEVQQMKAKEQFQQIRAKEQYQMQQLMQRHAQLQRRDANHPALNGAINGMNSDGILGSSAASSLAAKLYEERLKNPHSMDSEASPQLLDASRMALLKSGANHPGQLIHGNPGNVPSALQQIQARSQQAADVKAELGVAQRSMPMDPSSLYGQGIVQGKSPIGGPGLNQGVSNLPLKGWPLTVEQYRTSLTPQVQKSLVSSANQFQVLSSQQQQQFLAQAQAQGSLGNSHSYGEMDPRKFRPLTRGGLNVKNVQVTGNDGSIGSPIQSSSQMSRQDQSEYLMKMQQSAQQSQEQLPQQHQLQQNQKKRKPTSSGAANSTGTGNTVGPSTSPPSTPSTNTPGDGVTTAGNLPHVNGMAKSTMIYGTDGTGGLASSSNQMDDLENFGDIGSLDDNVESFLSPDDGDARDIFSGVKKSPTETNTESSKPGFSFTEFGCSRSNNKVLCCHFSSDGKLLASAGHERKILLWNMQNLQTESMSEEHTQIITDIRFRPDSTQLATSSFDRTVRLWNAAESKFSSFTLTGHSFQVTSLDFHPKKTDLLCSCDDNGEIRLWNISQCSGSLFMKGGSQQVRFQPRIGQFLAAAAENVVPIYDFETKRRTRLLQGHTKEIQSVCWDTNGEYLASVSHDVVKVWSLASGERIHELNSNGINFGSCVFHPTYPGLLIIGGYQAIQLWNMVENKTMTVSAHDSLIASLASSVTGTTASVSHDKAVKLWK